MISLNGEWRARGVKADGEELSFSGTVPGCVHTDLIRAGVLPQNIYWRDHYRACTWIEDADFTYEKTFTVDAIPGPAELAFDGLDTYATVYLNGEKVGESDDMFIPYTFDVSSVLRVGENTVTVAFRSPIREVKDLPEYEGAFTRERMNTRRIQCTYSWDWVERFVTMGIFRDARVVFPQKNGISHAYIRTKHVIGDYALLRLDVAIRDFARGEDRLYIRIDDPDGRPVIEKSRVIVEERLTDEFTVASPSLWYPAGYGEQPLYVLTLRTPSSEQVIRFGIREIVILQPEDEPGSEAALMCEAKKTDPRFAFAEHNDRSAAFLVVCNGRRVFCRGADWVPCEPFPSEETPEKIEKILSLSRAGGVNTVRVWGGGIFEQDAFYDTCDALGILVTQDFLMACGCYPEHEAWFLDALRREARAGALRLRNHPCLLFWCGDNENAVMGSENRVDFSGYRSATYAIGPVLAELDPDRPFLASSPYGGDCYCSATRGTTHNTYFLSSMFDYILSSDFRDFRQHREGYFARFNAEQPVFGMTFTSFLRRYMTEEDIFGEDTAMLEAHTKNNPALQVSLWDYTDRMIRKIFGEYTDGADRIRKWQMLQCEAIRYSMEQFRRNKWFSSGILYWMLDDCWPAAGGWSLLDYDAGPKPGYYAFRRATREVIAALTEEGGTVTVTVVSDRATPVSGHGRVYLWDVKREKCVREAAFLFSDVTDEARAVFRVKMPADETQLLVCDLTGTDFADRAFLVPVRYQDIPFTPGDVTVVGEDDESVTVTADHTIPCVLLDRPALLSDNAFLLLKGETRTIRKERKL